MRSPGIAESLGIPPRHVRSLAADQQGEHSTRSGRGQDHCRHEPSWSSVAFRFHVDLRKMDQTTCPPETRPRRQAAPLPDAGMRSCAFRTLRRWKYRKEGRIAITNGSKEPSSNADPSAPASERCGRSKAAQRLRQNLCERDYLPCARQRCTVRSTRSSSPPLSRHSSVKLGSSEAGRLASSRVSKLTRIGIETPSPQMIHSRLRSAGIESRKPRAPSG